MVAPLLLVALIPRGGERHRSPAPLLCSIVSVGGCGTCAPLLDQGTAGAAVGPSCPKQPPAREFAFSTKSEEVPCSGGWPRTSDLGTDANCHQRKLGRGQG